ncbi:hypothetical protein DL764_010032 [Monosporascus ibericus]|uniref:Uncharacterized protein n=1 Tax=Monosporascus ibericus TaxID=155417 RepID=A0A4Q4STH0_9PEZI|nr:hypothetical protein DL764_010032 [Monosporascus ibericus]
MATDTPSAYDEDMLVRDAYVAISLPPRRVTPRYHCGKQRGNAENSGFIYAFKRMQTESSKKKEASVSTAGSTLRAESDASPKGDEKVFAD